MFSWLSFLTNLIRLVLEMVRYLERRQLIRQVEATQLEALMERAYEIAQSAQVARANTPIDDDSLFDDPNNRANKRQESVRPGDKDSSL